MRVGSGHLLMPGGVVRFLATRVENRSRSTMSRYTVCIRDQWPRRVSGASCQHTASRSQCAGTVDRSATLRRPPATSAPIRARAATACSDVAAVASTSLAATPKRSDRMYTDPQLPDEDLQRALQCGGFGCTALLAEASPTSQGHAAGDGECDDGARRNDEGQRHAIAAAQGTTGRRRRTRATGRSASRRCRDGLGMINSATANVRAAALMTAPVAHQSP